MSKNHNGLEVTIPVEWVEEADMTGFSPRSRSAPVEDGFPGAVEVPIQDISPVRRAPGIPLLSHVRTVKWLRRIQAGVPIKPIQIVPGTRPIQVYNGAHRLYTLLLTGFSHIWIVPHQV